MLHQAKFDVQWRNDGFPSTNWRYIDYVSFYNCDEISRWPPLFHPV